MAQPGDAPQVRQAGLPDLDALAALFDAYRQSQGQPSDMAAARAFLQARIDYGQSVLFLALDGGRAAGFTQLYPSFSSVGLSRVFQLNDLYVDAGHRRRGVATRLLDAAEAYAWSLGASRLSLNVARGNVAAQQVYATRGWQADTQFDAFHRYPPAP